jgi:hypothetical protein
MSRHLAMHLENTNYSRFDEENRTCYDLEFPYRAVDRYSHSCFPLEYLYPMCIHVRPVNVVETGVHHGVSSAFILAALQKTGGRLYSIDLPNAEYKTDKGKIQRDMLLAPEPGFLVPDRLKANWKLELGDSKDKLQGLLSSIDRLDIFHHDSMHTYEHMMFEYDVAWGRLSDNGLLLSHDIDWCSAFVDFCSTRNIDYLIHKGVGVAWKR